MHEKDDVMEKVPTLGPGREGRDDVMEKDPARGVPAHMVAFETYTIHTLMVGGLKIAAVGFI